MLTSPCSSSSSSSRSDTGLDFNFFQTGPSITDTGSTSARPGRRDNAQHAGDACISTEESSYRVAMGGREIELMRDPMAGTGGLLWPAGEVLADYLIRQGRSDPALFRDKAILELGSGTGVVGLGLAMNLDLGRGSLTMTDLGKVVPILERNILLNGSPPSVNVKELEWGKPPEDQNLTTCDLILLADCIYLEPLFDPLISTLLEVMQKDGAVAYLCYKKRRKADVRFFKQLKRHFTLQELEAEQQRARKDSIHLYKVMRKW